MTWEYYTVRGRVLEDAKHLTEGDRNATYGPPTAEYERLARLWGAYLGIDLTAAQAAMCMALLKLNRTIASPDYRDNYVDLAAYAAIAFEATG